MHPNEIEQQIKADYDKFLNAQYPNEVPENFLQLFEKSIRVVPPQAHGINFTKIKSILDKQHHELSVSDINDMVKLIFNTPLEALHDYDDVYEMVLEQIKREKFVLKFNFYLKDFKDGLDKKREMLAKLSDGILPQGMRAIPNGKHY